jgi:hypothetical protein
MPYSSGSRWLWITWGPMSLYADHDRVVKLLHVLDHTVWKVEVILESKKYTTLTVNVTPVSPKKTKCVTICMPGSSFMHIVTYKWIQKECHVRKRKIMRDLHLILEMKAPNITGSRLGLRMPSSSNIFIAASSFWATLFIARVSTCRTQQVWGKDECKCFIVDWAISI